MELKLSWFELGCVIEEHEAHHNHHELKVFCDRYYPRASRVVVQAVQEYNDNNYYFTFGPSNISVWDGERALCVPTDAVALLVLLAESANLEAVLEEDKPDDPLGWLEERYGEDVYNLELCGIEKGYDIEVDLALPPPQPTRVYVKRMPYLLMTKSYDYDDQFYYEQEGGYPELLFEDVQRLRAVETLAARRQDEWPSCTPLGVYYQEQPLSDFSSSALGSDALARGVSAVLQRPLDAQKVLELDFQSLPLTDEQRRLIGLMFDRIGHYYLEYVSRYQKGV